RDKLVTGVQTCALPISLLATVPDRCLPLNRTHSICELSRVLRAAGIDPELSQEECELLDSIYLPSKYPPDSALPDSSPTRSICRSEERRVGKEVRAMLL